MAAQLPQYATRVWWALCCGFFTCGLLLQDLSGKDQEKVAEVTRVRVELLEQIGQLEAERTTQEGLRAKINALEREMKGTLLRFFMLSFVMFRASEPKGRSEVW